MLNDMSNCTGCHACMNICPKSCISMEDNGEGFYILILMRMNVLIVDSVRGLVRLLMKPN